MRTPSINGSHVGAHALTAAASSNRCVFRSSSTRSSSSLARFTIIGGSGSGLQAKQRAPVTVLGAELALGYPQNHAEVTVLNNLAGCPPLVLGISIVGNDPKKRESATRPRRTTTHAGSTSQRKCEDCQRPTEIRRGPLERIAARGDELVPDAQAHGVTVWHRYAMDAMPAVAYAAQTQLTGETDTAMWAARQAHEAAALYVRRRDRLNLRSESEAALLDRDPVVQDELSRQDRDLDLLGRDTPRDAKLSNLRHSAEETRLFELDTVT